MKLQKIDVAVINGRESEIVTVFKKLNEIIFCLDALIDSYEALKEQVDGIDDALHNHIMNFEMHSSSNIVTYTVDSKNGAGGGGCPGIVSKYCTCKGSNDPFNSGICHNYGCGKPLPKNEELRGKIIDILYFANIAGNCADLADSILELLK